MSSNQRKILIVEDDPDIAGLVELHLQDLGCLVVAERDGRAGLDRALKGDLDLIVLDLMLPGIDGKEICRQVRTRADYTPILMLTAKSSEIDRVVGLELGADDYISKPFSILELVARVKAIFRRIDSMRSASPDSSAEHVRIGEIEIDAVSRRVSVGGRPAELTAREFDLLLHFARHPGRVFTRSQLLGSVWGYGHEGYEHTVNSHINRLRAKIEPDPSEPRFILTVWGVGYRMFDPSEE
ncbi:MAG: response regulator transcription factor [Acidobacteriota bacterium]|nr:response regulator transcription factor [Acidobacteriota bacterium]